MPLIVGHRGASADFPENTLEAFVGARAQGADWVEFDVRRTRDGVLVVHHDPVLSDGRVIAESPFSELSKVLATLADALVTCNPMGVNVEIKNSPGGPGFDASGDLARQTVREIGQYAAGLDVLVSSFDLPTIDAVREADASIDTGYLVLSCDLPLDAVATSVERGHGAINPWDAGLTADVVSRIHDAGLLVNVWTVDDVDRIQELHGWGVDAIITNCPAVALESVGRSILRP